MLHSLIGFTLLCQGGDFQYTPHEEPPIAYFDVVPQQDVVGIFNVGVVAYHLEGVSDVTFTIHREGFEGDFNRDGTVNGDDLSVLFSRWDSEVGGRALANLLGHWGTSTPIPPQILGVFDQVMNPRTGQEEYWIPLDTRLHPDTKITITASVSPIEGPTVTLNQDVAELITEGNYNIRPQYSGVNLFSNNYGQWPVMERYVSPNGSDETGDGTIQNPYKGINRAVRADLQMPHGEVGGTIVYLLEGGHVIDETGGWPNNSFEQSNGRFITITPAPGVNPEDAKIVGNENDATLLRSNFVHFKNVVVESGDEQLLSPSSRSIKWYDNCKVRGLEEDWWNGNYYKLSQTHGYQYWTDCLQAYQAEGMNGIIMRNVHYDYIQCDAIEMHWMQLGLDLLITHHNENYVNFPTACHTDYIQCNGGFPYIHQNIIFRDIYGNHSCQEQGCHMSPGLSEMHNIAWVNIELSNTGGNGVEECNIPAVIFRWVGPGKNNLFKDCIFNGRPDGNSHARVNFSLIHDDGTRNTEGPWALGHDGVSPRFINVKFEDCWNDWDKTKPLFPVPDSGEPWTFYGPEELQWDPDTRDDFQPNVFGPNDPWFSSITGIYYTQTE